ncbi:MAG: hypothetical protein WCE66_11500, partial [Azonexus sp.]
MREIQRGMRRAGRWQACQTQLGDARVSPEMLAKKLFGGAAVKEDVFDRTLAGEKSGEIIYHQRFRFNRRIEAARAAAGMQHVPDGDAG